jgi:hypothetical protein
MKNFTFLLILLMISVAGFSQVTFKKHGEIATRTEAFGLTVGKGCILLQTDSLYWIRVDSTFSKTDSLQTVYRSGKWKPFNNRPYLCTGADSNAVTWPEGTILTTKWNVWFKRNGVWTKL